MTMKIPHEAIANHLLTLIDEVKRGEIIGLCMVCQRKGQPPSSYCSSIANENNASLIATLHLVAIDLQVAYTFEMRFLEMLEKFGLMRTEQVDE